MAKPFICKVALAQISINPAYADELASWIQEPTFPGENEKIGLFSIAGLEEIARLQKNIGEKYIAHLNRKVETIVRFASAHQTELLVFPEYSIPPESLPLCYSLAEELGITIVAGSHVMTLNEAAQQIYRDLEIQFKEEAAATEQGVRRAACVVFIPKQKPLGFVKSVRSKWEGYLAKSTPKSHVFEFDAKKGRIEVQIMICIEALAGKAPKEKHTISRLVVIPAFTPTTEPFHDQAKQNLLKGKCTLFANVAEFGGSKVFVRADNASLWFTENSGNKPIPKGSEALVIVEADLEKQFEVRQLLSEHRAVHDLRVFPMLYTAESKEALQYFDTIGALSAANPTLTEISNQISAFTTLNVNAFPTLLQEKLQHYTGHIASSGTISIEDAIKWVTPIVVPDLHSTDGLRWELCNESINTVNGLQTSGRYVHRTKELTDVYFHLLNSRNALAGSIQIRSDDSSTAASPKPAPKVPLESPFIDRDPAFDRIRNFFNQQQTSVFLLGGMRGIGKNSLVVEAFRQAIPPWKRILVPLTEGISYQRLLASLAFECNLQLPENLNLSNEATQAEIKKRVLAYLGRGQGTVFVFSQFQYLLNSSAEIEDQAIHDLLFDLAEAGQRGKVKSFYISHVYPRLRPNFQSLVTSYTLQGLEPAYTRRLLTQLAQSERDDLAGQLPAPSERLISTLGGHPLATKLAAHVWVNNLTVDMAEEFSIFKELRDSIVIFILEKISLSAAEHDLLSFASIFRVPAPREVFLNWRKEDANNLLNSVASRYLIESSETGYQLHPLVRGYFGNSLPPEQAKAWNKVAGKFYLQEFERIKKTSNQIVPTYLGEAVHHFLAAGDRQRVENLAFYRQELRPVAYDHFKNGEFRVALKDYDVLLEFDKNDLDAHFHLSLICAALGRWADADYHFGKALTLRPKAPWILQGFAKALLRAGKVGEGENLLLEAEESNPNHSPTLVELGRLREKQHRSSEAHDYYRRAISADPNNSYAYYMFSGFLYREGEIQEAYEMAKAALVSNPLNSRNKELVNKLKAQITEATSVSESNAKPMTAIAVKIKCSGKTGVGTADPRVESIGGVNSNGRSWKTSAAEAIAHIERKKYEFFVETSVGKRVYVKIDHDAAGRKYLKATTDSEQKDILLLLPDCS